MAPMALRVHCGHRQDVPSDIGRTHGRQWIFWRPNPESPLRHYRLRTVTYGLAPAPYLAIRVLQQLAIDDGHRFSATVPIIESSIYIDDTLFGRDTNCVKRGTNIIGLMKGGGFQLRKWAANSPVLLEDTASQHELADHLLAKDETLKILGLSWLSQEDVFCFVITSSVTASLTRRSILSFVAKLYDPLEWAAPVITTMTKILQRFCFKSSGCSRTIEMRQSHKN
jgi:hypothetical protein